MTKGTICLIFSFIALCSVDLSAQTLTPIDSSLAEIKSLFDNGSYISAELQARRLLEDRRVSDSARVQLEKYVAFSLVAQGKNNSATEHFVNALRIDSSLTLDTVLTSPKILAVFNAAKVEFYKENQEVRFAGSRPGAAPGASSDRSFRTIVFPGWEQVYQGRTEKGDILLGAGAVTAISSITFDFLRRDARTKYLQATTPELASSRYNTYNAYYKTEFYSVSAFILVYLYSEIDAFVNLPPHFKLDYSPARNRIGIQFDF